MVNSKQSKGPFSLIGDMHRCTHRAPAGFRLVDMAESCGEGKFPDRYVN